MTCSHCGQQLVPGRSFCGSCGTAVAAEATATLGFVPATAMHEPASTTLVREHIEPPRAARSRHEVSLADSLQFKLAHGEVVKGTFDIAGWTKRLGSMRGRLVVTDARVLYKARAKNILNESQVDSEIQLQDVSGLTLRANRGLNPVGIAVLVMMAIGLGLLELLLLVAVGFSGQFGAFIGIGFVIFLVFALLGWQTYRAARMEGVVFSIQTRAAGGTPLLISGFPESRWSPMQLLAFPLLGLFERLGVDNASMTDSDASYDLTREMFDEIGALILDLQNRGVLADSVN